MGSENFTLSDFKRRVIYSSNLYFDQDTLGNQYVFETVIDDSSFKPNVYLSILSSVDTRTDESRENTAIQVKLLTSNDNLVALEKGEYNHIKRTGRWWERVLNRINEFNDNLEDVIETCPDCGSPMELKDGIQCSNWDCQ